MDYEVFLVSRIREIWLKARAAEGGAAPKTRAGGGGRQRREVALGLARTGRVVTAGRAADGDPIRRVIAAQVAFMRMFGLGLTIAVLVDGPWSAAAGASAHACARPVEMVGAQTVGPPHERIGISESVTRTVPTG